jgi:hypothetical protein
MLTSFRAKRRRAAGLLRLLSKPKEGAFVFCASLRWSSEKKISTHKAGRYVVTSLQAE